MRCDQCKMFEPSGQYGNCHWEPQVVQVKPEHWCGQFRGPDVIVIPPPTDEQRASFAEAVKNGHIVECELPEKWQPKQAAGRKKR